MTNREREIKFLERLYGADEVKTTMDHDFELEDLTRQVLADATRAAERAGRDDLAGLACYFCGRSTSEVALSRCSCGYPSEFACGINGRQVCADCEQAHQAVAAHLEKLFVAPVVNRVNARRVQYNHQLSRAVRALYPEDAEPRDCPLFRALAAADEFDTNKDRFRSAVLRAFRKARFLDFQGLAKNLQTEEYDSLLRSVVRAGWR